MGLILSLFCKKGKQTQKASPGRQRLERGKSLMVCLPLQGSLEPMCFPASLVAIILTTPFAWTTAAAPHLSPISALAVLHPQSVSYIAARAIFSEHTSVCVTLLVKPHQSFSLLLKNLTFYWSKVDLQCVLVSAVQQRESTIRTHMLFSC